MIIDAHCHLGHDYVFDIENTEEDLVNSYREYGIDGGIVQPFISRPYIEDTRAAHDKIFKLTKKYEGSFWGLASINPHFKPEEYKSEAVRCINSLGFIGLKITPAGHAVHPLSEDAHFVYRTALALDVPVMIHTGYGIPFSDPIHVAGVAEAYPDLTIVLAHAGSNFYLSQALYVVQKYSNVFMEPSGSGIEQMITLFDKIGAERIMFSTDTIEQIPTSLTIYKSITNADMANSSFSETAIKAFKLPHEKIKSLSQF